MRAFIVFCFLALAFRLDAQTIPLSQSLNNLGVAASVTGADSVVVVQGSVGKKADVNLFETIFQPLDSDLTLFGAITPSANVQTLLGAATYAAIRTQLALVIGTDVQAFDADLTTYAGITPSANVQSLLGAADYAAMRSQLGLVIGTDVLAPGGNGSSLTGITGPQVAFADTDSNFAATNVQAAIEELDDTNGGGPNAVDGKVEWSQLVGVPAGFADGSDDGGGGSGTLNALKEDGTQVGGSDIVTLDFLGADFDLTESPDTEVNVAISSAIARDAEVAATYATQATTLTVAGTANEISSSAGAQDLSTNRTWTLSLPSTVTLTGKTLNLPSSNADPGTTAGQLRHDTAITELTGGALKWYDGTSVRTLVDLDAAPSNDDFVVAYDAAATKFYLKADSEGAGGADADAIHDNVAAEISAITAKATPLAADFLLIEDSAAADAKKRITIGSLETALEGVIALQDLQGAVTDAQVPNSITIDLATTATTANAGDSATAFFSAGQIERARGGTGADTSATGVGLFGSDGANAFVDVDTADELSAAIGGQTTGTGSFARAGSPTFTGNLLYNHILPTAAGSQLIAGNTGFLAFNVSTKFSAPSDGVLLVSNNAATDFSRLQFGGTTASFPAIKRNTTTLNFRLADDSADAALTAAAGTFSGLVTASANATIGNGATSAGVLTLLEDTDAGSNFASFKVPSLAANTVYTLPPDDGDAGEVLSTDGAGVLTWETPSGAGDVTAAATFGTDNVLIKSDGTGKGVQATGISVDDSNNITGITSVAATTTSTETLSILDNVDQSHGLSLVANEDLAAGINLNLDLDGASRNLNIQGNVVLPAGTALIAGGTLTGAGGGITLNAAGFNGNLATTDDTLQEVAQKLDDLSVGGVTNWTDIADASGDTAIALAGFETDFTSSIDAAGEAAWTLTMTGADIINDSSAFDIKFNDGADANAFYLRMIGDADGSPTNDFLFSQAGFTSLLPVNVPAEAFDSTGWNGDTGAPQKDAVRDEMILKANLAGGNTFTGTQVFPSGQALIAPALGTIASGVGTALTALNGENIQDDTIDDDSIDFGIGTDQVSAADIPIADAGSDFTATDVEGALDEHQADIETLQSGKVATTTTLTVAGTANEITSSAGAQDLSTNRTWTLSLPSALTFTGKTITGGTFVGPSVGNGATSAGVLSILEDTDDGSNFASFTVPALAANTVYTLPPDDGDAGEQLQTDGAGVLTWEAAGGGGSLDIDALAAVTEADVDADDVIAVSVDGTESKMTLDNLQDWIESLTLTITSISSETFSILDNVDQSHGLSLVANEDLAAGINLNLDLDGASRNLNIQGNVVLPAGTALVSGGALGTPSGGTLTNATGLPVSTGISGLGTGVSDWLATPSSANLATAVTGETGSGALVFAASPAIVTPSVNNGSTEGGYIAFSEDSDNGSDVVRLRGQNSVAASFDVTLPNAASTLPIFGQQITFAGPTAARTITLPDEAFTAVGVTTTQTLENKDLTNANNTLPCEFIIACSDLTTALTTGTTKAYFRAPYAFTVTSVSASVLTAPTDAILIVDINDSGTTIMTTNKLSIDATELTSSTAATAPGITDTAIAADAVIAIDIDQIGSTVAGAGLIVTIQGTR